MLLLTILFLLLAGCILTHSSLSLSYAAMGLELWFRNMIPSLLPFMILSGIMIRMNLTEKASMILYPFVKPIYKIRKNVCYAMLIGFLCGFPMGAKVTADLYTRQRVTKKEAEYLLAFCNNIGPVYFCSFVLPLLNRRLVLPYLFGMYGIPLLYGLILRYTVYRDLPHCRDNAVYRDLPHPMENTVYHSLPQPGENTAYRDLTNTKDNSVYRELKPPKRKRNTTPELICCGNATGTEAAHQKRSIAEALLAETDRSIQSSIQSILSLGGYMILYNLLNLIPHILLGHPLQLLSPLLEITGGLKLLGSALPLYSLLALSFGGFSCIAQTYSCIGDLDLRIGNYIIHKIILTILNGIFYLCWFQISPFNFLR